MAEPEVPDGAAVFPLIPAELGIQPLLLAVLHAIVFLDGSDKSVVQSDAAAEALEYIATYLQRLSGKDLARVKEDLQVLRTLAQQEKWQKAEVQFLKGFVGNYGIGS
jgi:hypothetical protein